MKKYITVTGYGIVAKEFIKLIMEKEKELKHKYGLQLIIKSIIGSEYKIKEIEGIDIEALLRFNLGSKALKDYCQYKSIKAYKDKQLNGDILVECTPTDIETGEPALSYIYDAIDKNMDIALASKGALVREYDKISTLIKAKNLNLKISGATAAALPTLDLGIQGIRGSKVKCIKGILNGTSNYILTMMMRENMSYNEALDIAIKKGIAEKNNKLDVSGIDTACKILLISNRILDKNFTLNDISIKGIEDLTIDEIRKAIHENSVIKLIGTCEVNEEDISIRVEPECISNNDQLSMVNYNNKAICFTTEETGEIFCSGGASNPRAAAYSLLKDIINMYS